MFICDIPAVDAELCEESQLGKFIVTATEEDKLSIYTTTVILNGVTKSSPVAYQVSKTGYYCVGAVPLTTEGVEGTDDVQYTGVVDFRNVFVGHLPAAEYPKILVSPPAASLPYAVSDSRESRSSTKLSPSSTSVSPSAGYSSASKTEPTSSPSSTTSPPRPSSSSSKCSPSPRTTDISIRAGTKESLEGC